MPQEEIEEKTNYTPIVVATAGTGILVISGIFLWKRKKKDNLDPVDHRDRGGGRAEYPVFGTDVVSGIGLWDYQ